VTTWDPQERLEELESVLEALSLLPDDFVILVEGRRDIGSLHLLGVKREMIAVQTQGGLLGVAESLCAQGKKAVILTDWDRKGGQLARLLRQGLESCGVPYDEELRRRMARVCSGEVKDVESLPTYFTRLVKAAQVKQGRK
jgi:dTMP kinase